MTMRGTLCTVLAAFLLWGATNSPINAGQLAASSGAATAPLDRTVPVDPRITVGTLPNGLR